MKAKNTIFIFVAASLLLHAALFMQTTSQDIILPANMGNIISITISAPTEAKASPKQLQIVKSLSPAIHKVTPNKPLKKTDKALSQIRQKETIKNNVLAKSKKDQPPLPLTLQQITSATSQTKIISLLKDKIQQYFYYPKLAQRQNWQGKVLLVFDINNQGIIKNITVKQSSGYSILDNAAKTSLTRITSIPKDWIKSEYYSNLKLTVKYRLEES